VPLDWAAAQNNLGGALLRLGTRESSSENAMARFQQADVAFRAALTELTRDRDPLRWAGIQHNLGTALMKLGERESGERGIAWLEKAVAALEAALSIFIKEGAKYNITLTRGNRDRAVALLAARRRANFP